MEALDDFPITCGAIGEGPSRGFFDWLRDQSANSDSRMPTYYPPTAALGGNSLLAVEARAVAIIAARPRHKAIGATRNPRPRRPAGPGSAKDGRSMVGR